MSNRFVAFGDRLRQIRKEMGLTQEEFANKLGTSKQALSRFSETSEQLALELAHFVHWFNLFRIHSSLDYFHLSILSITPYVFWSINP